MWISSSHPHSLLAGELLMMLIRVESTAGPVIVEMSIVLISSEAYGEAFVTLHFVL